jgi:hypothetical protein
LVNEKQVMLKKLITNILLGLKIIKAKEEVKTETNYVLSPIEEKDEWTEFKPVKKPKAKKVEKVKPNIKKQKNESKQARSKK